jgi:D-ribulokinase
MAHQEKGWDDSYFKQIGLGDLVEEVYQRIGTKIGSLGEKVGNGVTQVAAKQMGVKAGTPVSVGIIDAHAGGIGLIKLQNVTMIRNCRSCIEQEISNTG